ncbi:hypothetical protein PP357_gp57 [Arthrobacter phage Sarge]|uniref:Uncharacterized protein n=1 Tax=Arthrobacter phage Sarge TaxID=2885974 RepID=A0AAE9C203_9CAUD|nr:hypothetical protein PP357_gp57 [Arthrobacter phage Sarge]UDL14904.1 hypothetical protein SEA_SARGE_57 [Arthrobacter phage Sarge]
MITESQAKALAALLHEIRPRWSAPAMLKVFERNHTHPAPFPDITAAAVNAARDPKVETPGCIFTDRRFWPAEAKSWAPKPEPCPDHIGESAHNCRCCWADVKAGLRPQTHIGKHHEAAPEAASVILEEP